MLGRSKLEMNIRASRRCKRSTISLRVLASAVAVSAIRGTSGNRSASTARRMYSGRKSCPHWDTQCASSIANSASGVASSRSRQRSVSRRSGATYRRSSSPARAWRSTFCACAQVILELSAAARTPASSSAATWSCIKAMSGETTTPTPLRSSAGIWKQSDFPPPVGMSTSASFPAATCATISRCSPRKEEYPKTSLSTHSAREATSIPRPTPTHARKGRSIAARKPGDESSSPERGLLLQLEVVLDLHDARNARSVAQCLGGLISGVRATAQGHDAVLGRHLNALDDRRIVHRQLAHHPVGDLGIGDGGVRKSDAGEAQAAHHGGGKKRFCPAHLSQVLFTSN